MFTGILTAVAGYGVIYRPKTAGNWVDAHWGRLGWTLNRLLEDVLPRGVFMGQLLVLTGACIAAAGLAFAVTPFRHSTGEWNSRGTERVFRKTAIIVLLILCLCTGAVNMPLLHGDHPPGTAVWLFGAALILGAAASLVWDRRRGTRLGRILSGKREWIGLTVLVTSIILYIGHDIAHWRWAGTPDESHFFITARAMMDGRIQRFALSENGVFGYHPVLSSLVQGVFMQCLGGHIFGWRMSSVAILAVSLPFIYIFGREMIHRRVGIAAAVIFGTSQLAIAFAHFGYNNIQVHLPMASALAFLYLGIRRRSLLAFFVSGFCAGMGFYTYYPARLTVLLCGVLALSHGAFPVFRRGRSATLVFLLAFILTIMPLLMHAGEMMANMLQQTAVTGGKQITAKDVPGFMKSFFARKYRDTDSGPGNPGHHLKHWYLALSFGLFFHFPSHFIINPTVDPLTMFFFACGFFLAVMELWRHGGARFLVMGILTASFFTGAISQYSRPPLTRLQFLMPLICLTAAWALYRAAAVFSFNSNAPAREWRHLGHWVVVSIVFLNLLIVRTAVTRNYHGYGDGTTGELLRMVETLPEDYRIVYLQKRNSYMECVEYIFESYGMKDRLVFRRGYDLAAGETLLRINRPCAVFLGLKDDNEIISVKGRLYTRFPDCPWRNSDPGKKWNLNYLVVPGGPARSGR